MKQMKPRFFNHGRHPITEHGIYELKWNCQCCGEIIRKTTEVYTFDNQANYPCNCDEYPEPHLKLLGDNVYYRRIENV